MSDTLRIGFVTGATPDKWARNWRDRRRERLELVPVTEADQLDGVRDGSLDMALVRLPVDQDGLHCVRLYDEVQVVVASREHVIAATDDEVSPPTSSTSSSYAPTPSGWPPKAEQLDWPPMTRAGGDRDGRRRDGCRVVPMSVARLHQRKDVVTRVVTDLEPTTIALVWLRGARRRGDAGVRRRHQGTDGQDLALSLRRPGLGTGPACASSSPGASGNVGSALLRRLAETAGTSSSGWSGARRRTTEPPFPDVELGAPLDLTDDADDRALRAVLRGRRRRRPPRVGLPAVAPARPT